MYWTRLPSKQQKQQQQPQQHHRKCSQIDEDHTLIPHPHQGASPAGGEPGQPMPPGPPPLISLWKQGRQLGKMTVRPITSITMASIFPCQLPPPQALFPPTGRGMHMILISSSSNNNHNKDNSRSINTTAIWSCRRALRRTSRSEMATTAMMRRRRQDPGVWPRSSTPAATAATTTTTTTTITATPSATALGASTVSRGVAWRTGNGLWYKSTCSSQP
jgi:hypothetical protein